MTAKIIGKKVMLQDFPVLEGERKVDKIDFELPLSYGETDLSGLTAYANIKRADGTTDKITLDVTKTEENLQARLLIDASVTAVPGELGVHISFENDEGTVVFMTERFVLNVSPSVNAYRDFTDRTPGAIHKLQLDMLSYVKRMQELVDEYEQKENQGGSSGSGGGQVYDENNKLPASFVDGLANVATSGEYSDLNGTPDMSYYVNLSMFAQAIELFEQVTAPVYIENLSFSQETSELLAGCEANKALIKDWLSYGAFVRPLYLRNSSLNIIYPIHYASYSEGNQLDIYFQKETGLYSITYNIPNNTYGFSE